MLHEVSLNNGRSNGAQQLVIFGQPVMLDKTLVCGCAIGGFRRLCSYVATSHVLAHWPKHFVSSVNAQSCEIGRGTAAAATSATALAAVPSLGCPCGGFNDCPCGGSIGCPCGGFNDCPCGGSIGCPCGGFNDWKKGRFAHGCEVEDLQLSVDKQLLLYSIYAGFFAAAAASPATPTLPKLHDLRGFS